MGRINYLTLPDGKKFPLLKQEKNRKPQFCNQFKVLWKLLYDVGEQDYPIYSGIIRSFPKTQKLVSKLIGNPELTDPTSIVKVYSFVNKDLLGPVTNNGYELELYNNLVSYELKWKVKDNIEGLLIGFYRSSGYVNDNTNKLSLICSEQGVSLFRKRSGSFIFQGVTNLYVACNKNTTIELEIKAVIPNQITIPLITPDNPYVKYMLINEEGKRYKIPVYESFVLNNTPDVIKRPSIYFFEATKVIQNYLRDTGLSITLIPDEISNNNKLINRQVISCSTCVGVDCGENIIGTRPYQSSSLYLASVSTNTTNVCDRCYQVEDVYYGIKLFPPKGKVPKITFSSYIQNAPINAAPPFRGTACIQYLINGISPITYKVVNNLGETTTQNAETFTDFSAPSPSGVIFTGEFRIPETATEFLVTIYFEITVNVSEEVRIHALEVLRDFTKFNKIRIDYENLRI